MGNLLNLRALTLIEKKGKTVRRSFTTAILIFTLIFGSIANANGDVQISSKQKAQLKYLIEEEKLARDVYAYLSREVTSQKFSNITKSEQTHMDFMSNILKQYGLKNPTKGMKEGEFKNSELQDLYKELIKEGATDIWSAYNVGVQIEELDITDLKKMMKDSWPTDVKSILDRLLSGSQNHLVAFSR